MDCREIAHIENSPFCGNCFTVQAGDSSLGYSWRWGCGADPGGMPVLVHCSSYPDHGEAQTLKSSIIGDKNAAELVRFVNKTLP